jgi:uncharacterized protein (TIGR03086 family)
MTAIETVELLNPVLAELADVAGGITPDQLAQPTPCPDYPVGILRDHVLSWLDAFATGYADPQGKAPIHELEGYHAPADAGATVRDSATKLDQAVRDGGGERPLFIGESSMPGDLALSMILWEYLVHGWDLARATGQPWQPADAACLAAYEFAPGMLPPDFQGPGKAFGDPVEVDADAPALDRLLGLSGRDPNWQPPVN